MGSVHRSTVGRLYPEGVSSNLSHLRSDRRCRVVGEELAARATGFHGGAPWERLGARRRLAGTALPALVCDANCTRSKRGR
jgi:hypothetical protein